jgi:hypothetical protein
MSRTESAAVTLLGRADPDWPLGRVVDSDVLKCDVFNEASGA